MSNLVKGKATICVVNYRTLDFTRLCLRSIRKFTSYPYEVIVVDNNSHDESLEYLKSLGWIRLIERRSQANEPGGGYAHAAGLDLGLENCNTEFFVSMHSDTFVRRQNWLTDLVSYFGDDENIACVGSGKIELIAKWRVLLKKSTDLRTFKRKIFREPDTVGKFRYYNRTICCLYRTDVLRREELSFLMGRDMGLTGGKKLYFELVDRGYKTVEIPPAIMGQFILHLAHATQVANLQEFTLRKRTIKKCRRLVDEVISSPIIQNILMDDLLDQ
jgi:glycosyltransferase involved in cell wall biosynthesis